MYNKEAVAVRVPFILMRSDVIPFKAAKGKKSGRHYWEYGGYADKVAECFVVARMGTSGASVSETTAFSFMQILSIMSKYIIRRYQVVYKSGDRDKVNLERPIHTDDKEAVRTRLKMKHNSHGMVCVGLNFDYDELNDEEL